LSEHYPWHEALLVRLQSLAARDQLPNAIALTCPPGWGHRTLLAEVALALLNVEGPRVVDEFAHPDFRWIAPDGAVIKIDQVRKLNEFAVQTPQMAPRKIAAVLDAHLLNANAANALLKTLEEPPPNTHLLLATPFWGKLLPTIRSRCQRFQVDADVELARAWLQTQGLEVAEEAFAEFGYAPLTTQAGFADETTDLASWLAALPKQALDKSVEVALENSTVLWLDRWYRRIVAHLQGKTIPQCHACATDLVGFADQLLQIRRQIEFSNAANARLLLEHLIVRWIQLRPQKRVK
jgi:DNA polymerase III delta subunit-like protein